LLLALGALLLFPLLGKGGLTDPDESAYAESVREMARHHDWLVPQLYGQPILHKPILIYWVLGASFRLLGQSELAARLPSVLAALALLLVVWRLGRLVHRNDDAALVGSLVLACSLEFVLMGRAAVTDMILTLWCTLAVLCYLEASRGARSRLLPLAGAVALGLAVLTKAPVGLLVPALALGSYLLASREWKSVLAWRPFSSVAMVAAVSLPWYGIIALKRPDLLKGFVLGGNLGRFLRPEHRSEPALYYLVVLLIGFLPWSAFLPGAMGRAFLSWMRKEQHAVPRMFPALWLVALTVFFTLAASKLPSYILPAFPAAALLAADPLAAWLAPPAPAKRLPGSGGVLLLVILAGGMVYFAMSRESFGALPSSIKPALLPICFSGLLGTLFALTCVILRKARLGFVLLLGGNAAMLLSLLTFGLPLLEPWKSSRPAAEAVRPMLGPDDRVFVLGEHNPGFGYYLDRDAEIFRRETDLEAQLGGSDRFFCLMDRGKYEKLRASRPELPLYLLKNVGNLVVMTNRSPAQAP